MSLCIQWNTLLQSISQNVFGQGSSWFWTMAEFFVILVTLLYISRQVRYQRQANMLSTFTALDRRWKSSEMREARKHACKDYGSAERTISQPEDLVLGFFEELGLYLRRKVFDLPTVWEFYSYDVEHYWPILEPRIREFRTSSKDDSWYSEFEYLNDEIVKYSKKKSCPTGKTDAEIKKFIRGELKDPTYDEDAES
jgi:hypothetical protein